MEAAKAQNWAVGLYPKEEKKVLLRLFNNTSSRSI
jgi:hypothetical protein